MPKIFCPHFFFLNENPLDACFSVEPLKSCPGWLLRHLDHKAQILSLSPSRITKWWFMGIFTRGLPDWASKKTLAVTQVHMPLVWEVQEVPPPLEACFCKTWPWCLPGAKEGLYFWIPFWLCDPRGTWVINNATSDMGDENEIPPLSKENENRIPSSVGERPLWCG